MHSSKLYAILNGKWQPDGDVGHALILDGDGHFTWVGDNLGDYNHDPRRQPSYGQWSVEGTKLVLRGSTVKVEPIKYAVEYNAAETEITLTPPDGLSRRFTRPGETQTEHPDRRADRCARFGLPPE